MATTQPKVADGGLQDLGSFLAQLDRMIGGGKTTGNSTSQTVSDPVANQQEELMLQKIFADTDPANLDALVGNILERAKQAFGPTLIGSNAAGIRSYSDTVLASLKNEAMARATGEAVKARLDATSQGNQTAAQLIASRANANKTTTGSDVKRTGSSDLGTLAAGLTVGSLGLDLAKKIKKGANDMFGMGEEDNPDIFASGDAGIGGGGITNVEAGTGGTGAVTGEAAVDSTAAGGSSAAAAEGAGAAVAGNEIAGAGSDAALIPAGGDLAGILDESVMSQIGEAPVGEGLASGFETGSALPVLDQAAAEQAAQDAAAMVATSDAGLSTGDSMAGTLESAAASPITDASGIGAILAAQGIAPGTAMPAAIIDSGAATGAGGGAMPPALIDSSVMGGTPVTDISSLTADELGASDLAGAGTEVSVGAGAEAGGAESAGAGFGAGSIAGPAMFVAALSDIFGGSHIVDSLFGGTDTDAHSIFGNFSMSSAGPTYNNGQQVSWDQYYNPNIYTPGGYNARDNSEGNSPYVSNQDMGLTLGDLSKDANGNFVLPDGFSSWTDYGRAYEQQAAEVNAKYEAINNANNRNDG